jgi:hypothetical protein
MRVELVALGFWCAGCAIDLDPIEEKSAPARDLPTLEGCLPLADRLDALDGRLSSAVLPDRGATLFANAARDEDGSRHLAFAIDVEDECPEGGEPLPTPLVDLSELEGELVAKPLSSVTLDESRETFLYFSADEPGGFASRGIGVARFSVSEARFVEPTLLWTSDRPSYGSGAAIEGNFVYVFGGLPARFLAADVYLARVPAGEVTNFAAYEYWSGGGHYDSDPDRAAPLLEGGVAPSVAFDSRHDRWLMAYSTPLSGDITLRSGLGAAGPWSAPLLIAEGDLPESDPESFCGDVTLLPALFAEDEITLGQAVGSFGRPPSATAEDFWTRLVRVPWPETLP